MAAAATSEDSAGGTFQSASGTGRPRLGIVVTGQGSVTAVEAYAALRDSYDPVFLVAPTAEDGGEAESPESAKLASRMRALSRRAEVCWLPSPALRDVPPALRDLSGVTTFCADGVEVTSWLAGAVGLPALGAGGGVSLYDKVAQRSDLGPDLSPGYVALPDPCCSAELAASDPHEGCDWPEWERAAARLGFPAVLKPARGQASRGVRRVEDVAGLRAARHEIVSARHRTSVSSGRATAPAAGGELAWLLEEFLTGHDRWPRAAYVSVESIVSRSDIRHVALTRKLPMAEPFREVGQYLLPRGNEDQASADEHRALLEAASQALSRLRVENAVTHTELKLTSQGPKVIEVNARVGGLIRDLVRAGRGVDLARAAAAVAVGGRPDCPDEAAEKAAGSGLVFQYGPLAPVRAAVFQRAHGVDAVLSLPGVDRYLPHVAAGELLPGGTETLTMAVVSGACRDEEELAAVVTELERVLSYEFRLHPDGQPVRCDARGVPIM
ncbi:MAG: ATP-grasp domain-containing protein [Jatrophihabitantaceae bacterium]